MFNKAFEKTMGHEGYYSFDPDDAGQETYMGISKIFWPNWKGWNEIDTYRFHPKFPEVLRSDQRIYELARDFYKEKFWNMFKGDSIKAEAVAEELFDTAVNQGTRTAVIFLQRALNSLNRNQTIFADLKVDGICGVYTIGVLNKYIKEDSEIELLCKIMNVLQGYRYIEIMEKNGVQEKYVRGWFNRINISKESKK